MKHTQRSAALLTALALLCALTLPAAAAAGTVTIATVQDLVDFSKQCTRDTWSQGRTVELAADLDLSGSDFTPVPIFQGTFRGNGHTISGLSFDQKGSKTGLFRTLTQSAVVENLTVEGTLSPQGSGGQVGLLAGENYGAVRHCTARGTVSAQEDVGGLVGINGESGVITACSSAAAVTGVTNVGGIAGQNLGTVEDCANAGSINTAPDQQVPNCVGGIAGLSRGTIRRCTNTGAVGYQHVGYNLGGIAGLQSGEIDCCSNAAPIRGRKDVGGIVGQFEPSTTLTYGPSPSQQLSDSLSALFGQLERFTEQLNGMISQGLDDAQAVHDSLSAIQERTYAAGTEGRTDFQAMSDQLTQYTAAVSGSLDALRGHLEQFGGEAGDQLQETLDQCDALLRRLEELAQTADQGLGGSIHALEDTVSAIRAQIGTIQSHRLAMARELDALKQYVADVARLVAAGEFRQALQLSFPTLDPVGHGKAIAAALTELPRLAAGLADQWADLYDRTAQDLGQSGADLDQALDGLYDALTGLHSAGDTFTSSSQEDLEQISQTSDQIQALLKAYTDSLGDQVQAAVDDIDRELTAIQDRVDAMTRSSRQDSDALHATSQAVLDQMDAVRQALLTLGEEPELTVTDLTDEIEQGPGLVQGCTVSDSVEGDSNVGGIVGAVSTEVWDDPEATFDLGDLKLMSDVYATLRAVVRDCRFDGAVTVKNECGGGVAGRCEAGAILDCAARGTVETGGDYCGGIVGRTRGKVLRCAALTDLTGGSWLGGIAGLGEDLTDCRAMVRADSAGEYQGAIAGQAEGALAGNRYLMEELAGVDGVDYAGTAQGLDFSEFAQLDYIPADFLTFSYRFVVNGQTVAEIPFSYGADLDRSQVPEAPEQDGQYGQWPDFPTEDLRRSLVLEAQFTAPASTLADQAGVAQLLVEGSFSPDAALTVQEETPPSQSFDRHTVRAAWRYAVTGSQDDTVTLRLRAEGVDAPAAAVYQNGVWTQVDSTLDGSYLVFQAPAQGQVLLLEGEPSSIRSVVAAAAGAGALAIALLLFRRHRTAAPKAGASSPAASV